MTTAVPLSRRPAHLLLATLVLTLAGTAHLRAAPGPDSDGLRAKVRDHASEIKKVLTAARESQVRVETYRPAKENARLDLGQAFSQMLAEELRKEKVDVVEQGARVVVRGSYRVTTDARGRLVTSFKTEVGRLTAVDTLGLDVAGLETAIRFLGFSGAIPTDNSGKEREALVAAVLDDPLAADNRPTPVAGVVIDGTAIRTSADSPYSVEVYVRPSAGGKYEPRKPQVQADGTLLVDIRHDEVYALRMHNKSKWDAAVKVHIDGLSAFHFSESHDYENFILPKDRSGSLMGWHRSNAKTDLFQVKGYSESAVAGAKAVAQPGLIHAWFARAWPEGAAIPEEERAFRLKQNRGDPVATARGAAVDSTYAEMKSHVGEFNNFIAIRYSR